MHRLIMNAKDGESVDHIDHNGLNNQKSNLRICTHQENLLNAQKMKGRLGKPTTSKYKGVYWDKDHRKWRARISTKERKIHVGLFHSEEDANDACKLAREQHGVVG